MVSGDGLRNKKITIILLVSVVLITFAVIVAAAPMGQGPASAVDQNTDDGISARADGRQELIVRSDLTGSAGPFLVGQPLFLQLCASSTNGTAFSDVLYVDGASFSDVQVRTFRPDGLSPPWEPVEDARGVHGALPGSGDEAAPWGTNGTLIMMSFGRVGDFSLEAANNAANGDRMGVSSKVNVSVIEAAYFFDVPRLGELSTTGWLDSLATGKEMNFTISASTTELWRTTENWTAYYNWTVSVINPEGMVGGDLAKYNTGALNVDQGDLERTSVVSAWENGYNTVFYTSWTGEGGLRLTGDAAMTPNGKQITYGGGVWDAWTKGVWQPEGAGHITFHQAGHYLFVFTLTKNGQAVSPPLVQEVTVH